MEIERHEEARLSVELEAEIAALLALAFPDPPGFEGRSFYCQRHHVRLVMRDPEVVGHLAVCMRTIRMGDTMRRMAGFAEVSTHPDRRGEGIAAALVAAGIEEARAMRADVVMLYGTAALYRGAGFVSVPNPIRSVDLGGVRTNTIKQAASDSFMIYPLNNLEWDDRATIDLVGGEF